MYLKASLGTLQALRLTETLVVGTEDDGHIPHGCLEHIVDAHAEAATDIGHVAVVVGARQQTETVDDETVGLCGFLLVGLGVAHGLHLEHVGNLAQMVLAYHVGRDDEFPLSMLVEIGNENLLVGLPGRASHKDGRLDIGIATHKGVDNGQTTGCLLNLEHAVEAGVAHHVDIGDADRGKQALRLLVLHEEAGEAGEHTAVAPSVPLEEDLLGAEDARHAVGGYAAVLEHMQEVVPELVLDEECHHGAHDAQELARIAYGVDGQIADDVGSLVVLAHLIARGREEGKQYLVLGVLAAHLFHQRAALFELAQRRSMKPDVAVGWVNLLTQYTERLLLSAPHLAHLV